jgi:hypothetical protein
MEFKFEDFIPVYPLQDDLDIQYKIGTKAEFLEVKSIYNEASPAQGSLYKHQEAFKRYMIQYDRMLNIHSVGTGKTCALVAVVEFMKKNPHFRKAYVLEKGDNTKEEFKKQIATKCTKDVYLTDKYKDAKDEVQKRSALTRAIRETYKIMSYGDLVNEVKRTGTSVQEIEKNYSGCIFIVDEAHNLLENSEKISKNTGDIVDYDEESQKDYKDKYNILWKLFHNIKRSKVILATATPMINEVKEIAKIMNLILPIDQQMPTEWTYEHVTLKQLEPFFRGRVSYVRSLDTGVIEDYQGINLNAEYEMEFADEDQDVPFEPTIKDEEGNEIYVPKNPKTRTSVKKYKSQNIIYPLIMNPFQASGYINSVKEDNKAVKKGAFMQDERQASCLVFPDGSYGGNFDSDVKLMSKAGKYIEKSGREYKVTNEFRKYFRSLDDVKKYSAKYSFIIEKELEAAAKREKGEIVGNAFCYNEFKTGSGLITFSKLLEEIAGFEKFNESSSVFNKDKFGNRTIRKDFTKKLRFGIITSNMENSEIESLLELFKSEENYNGEYCQLVIGSESARDGINLSNVMRGYLTVAGWNQSGTIQALGRFVRATSHDIILDKMRKKLESEGKDSTNVKARIEIYKLATLVNKDDIKDTKIFSANEKIGKKGFKNAIDLDLYALSDRKDISIRRMMKFLKQCSVDCSINYERNVRSGDKDNSVTCDYGKCNYVCYNSGFKSDVSQEDVDYSTYDILYSDEIVKQCQQEIRKIITKKSSIYVSELYKYKDLSLYKPRYINLAIDNLIKDKIKIKNKFGFPAFINTDGNAIFTQNELPTYSEKKANMSSINIYKDMIFSYYKNKFNDVINLISSDGEDKIYENLNKLGEITDENFEEFSNLYDRLSDDVRISLLEDSIIKRINIELKKKVFPENKMLSNNLTLGILRKYNKFIFAVNEPLTDIRKIKNHLETSGDRRGRVRKVKACPIVSSIELMGPDTNTELIYIHTAASFKVEVTSFRVNTQFMNPSEDIRIFKPSENEGWRNVYDYECQAYKNVILKTNQNILKEFKEKFNYFGTIAQDKKFRIISSKELNLDMNDQRTISKGTECNSFKEKFDLIEILRESNYIPDIINDLTLPYESREELEDYLLNVEKVSKTKEELSVYRTKDLLFFAKWFFAKKLANKREICSYIRELFEKENRIYNLN